MSHPPLSPTAASEPPKSSNFLRQIIESDLAEGRYGSRRWGGSPGPAAHHAAGMPDPAPIRTRFPPEPNGHLHIGHAKSICLNFGLARDYGGVCHLRFDDTNPETEDKAYIDAIVQAVRWLGFDWQSQFDGQAKSHFYYASHYFDFMYQAAEHLIEAGHAYVDEQTPQVMRANRGDFSTPGIDSPYRGRTPEQNLTRFRQMREGQLPDGAAVLRAKIDMASPNLNLRDPVIYRIRRATHHSTGNAWCIYPMYTFAHPIEDALENITHSICTLEFEDQRPFYDWLMARLCHTHTLADGRIIGGLLNLPPPKQYEFARLNLSHVVTSKRKLRQLVEQGHVQGWDDPRMPTLLGLRRRGYTPQSIWLFAERIGVSKTDSWIDYSTLEGCLREDLENKAPRGMAVLDPIKLILTNWAELFDTDAYTEDCVQPALPPGSLPASDQAQPLRHFKIGKEVWIERQDFAHIPPKGYKRLYPPQQPAAGKAGGDELPGSLVRLKGGYIVQCTGCVQDASGTVTEVHARVIPHTKSGTPGADSVKAKAAITWVSVADGVPAQVRLYDRLFTDPHPDASGKDFIQTLNPHSLKVVQAYVEPSLAAAKPEDRFQFERLGYFVADRQDHGVNGQLVFNRITELKDGWSR